MAGYCSAPDTTPASNSHSPLSIFSRTCFIFLSPKGGEENAVVSNEEANRMSLFYAYPTPMLKTLSDATTKFVSEVRAFVLEEQWGLPL